VGQYLSRSGRINFLPVNPVKSGNDNFFQARLGKSGKDNFLLALAVGFLPAFYRLFTGT